ncbi:MAG: 3-ketoacyl-ACP reductase [Hyphomicrobiales bacterium]
MNKQVALVTGSSRGIGLATAMELARKGFSVAVNGPLDDAELDAAVSAVSAYGVQAVKAVCDISNVSGHEELLGDIESALGPLTTLVNNAGVGVLSRGDLLDVTEESYDRCLSINTKAMFFLSQAFSRRLVSRQRDDELFYSIVNVTSSNAEAVAVQRGEYCASKAAAGMISKTFAVRLGEENVAVYDVRPGLIATEMTAPVIAQYEQRAKDGLTLFPRIGQPQDVGKIISTLVSGELPYTTGQTIFADAGMLVSRF